jgi:hypothetical protein
VIGLAFPSLVMVAGGTWVILSLLVWRRWGCLAAIILGLTLIPAAAGMLGYGVVFATTALTSASRDTLQSAGQQRQCRLHGDAAAIGVTLDYRGQLPDDFCQLPQGSCWSRAAWSRCSMVAATGGASGC